METLKNCPVCNQDKFNPFLSCVDYTVSRETFQIVQCAACGFRFTNPRPDENEIGKYYQAEEYISHSDTSKGIVNKLYQIVRNHTIKQKVKLINQLVKSQKSVRKDSFGEVKSLLDIGCGTGEFLNACKENGWNVTGIEPSEIARKNAEQKYGIKPLPQEKLFEISERKFNVITLWHVLEHIYQLDKTIDQIKKIIADNGTLIVAVPNCNSFDAKRSPPPILKHCNTNSGSFFNLSLIFIITSPLFSTSLFKNSKINSLLSFISSEAYLKLVISFSVDK